MLSIVTNELALNAQRHLGQTNDRLQSTLERLSTGSRIVRASDDAAGLAISDGLNAQIRSLGRAIRNAQDGQSLVQIYEGGTNELTNMLVRIRELAMQSASDTVSDNERVMINNETTQLTQEIERVAQTTKYAGKKLLADDQLVLDFQVGTGSDPFVDRITFSPGNTDLTARSLGVADLSVADKEGAQNALETIDSAIFRVNEVRARVGSVSSRLVSTVEASGIFQENLMAAKARIRDADLAAESSNLARETILRKAGVAVLTQANENPGVALQLLRQ